MSLSDLTSSTAHLPPRIVDTLVQTEPTLNKSASDTELHMMLDSAQFSPTACVSQRKKRCRAQLDVSISSQMDDFKEEIRRLITYYAASQTNELRKLTNTLQDIQQSNSNIEDSLNFLAQQNEEYKKRIDCLEVQMKKDREYITVLENKIEDLEMGSRRTCLEVKNVPKKDKETKEDLIEMVLCLSRNIDCQISRSDINDIYRIRPNKADIKNTPIVMETTSTILKTQFMKLSRSFNKTNKDKLRAKHMGFKTQEDTPIYISEHLTTKGAYLYYLARDLVKVHSFNYCWTSYGRVYVRKNESSPIIMIKNEAQALQLREKQQDKTA